MKNIQKTLLTLALVLFTNLCFAPPAPPTSGNNTSNNNSVDRQKTETPIPTATLLLLGLVSAFGITRVAKERKKNK